MRCSGHDFSRRSRGGWAVPFLLFFLMSAAHGQVFEWAGAGSGKTWKHANAIAVDANGNSLAVGEFGSIPSPFGITFGTQTLIPVGDVDGFITMYDKTGDRKWTYQIKAASHGAVRVTSIAVGAPGTFYVTGELQGTVDFDATHQKPGVPSGSSFIAKYDYAASGPSVTWVQIAQPATSNPASVRAAAIATDGAGSVYLCGSAIGDVKFMGASASVPDNGSTAAWRLFVAKYVESTSDASPAWVRGNSGPGEAHGRSIAMAGPSSVVVAGSFRNTISMGTTLTGQSRENLVVTRYSATGVLQWTAMGRGKTGSPARDSVTGGAIAADRSGTAIYVTGRFAGDVDFMSAGSSSASASVHADGGDFYAVRFDQDGKVDASFLLKGGTDLTSDAFGNGIAIHDPVAGQHDTIYVTGGFSGRMEQSGLTLASLGNHDLFVAAFDETSRQLWRQRGGHILGAADRHHYDQGTGIAVGSDGLARVVGEFGGGAARFFDKSDLTGDHFRNVFIAQLSSNARAVSGLVLRSGAGVGNYPIAIEAPSGRVDHVLTGSTGQYIAYFPLQIPAGATYHIRPAGAPAATSPSEYIVSDGSADMGIAPQDSSLVEAERNFTMTSQDSVADLGVSITTQTSEFAVPGSTVCYVIRYWNQGGASANGATIDLKYDPHLTRTFYQPYGGVSVSIVNDQPLNHSCSFKINQTIPWSGWGEIAVAFKTDTPMVDSTMLSSTVTIIDPIQNANTSYVQQIVFYPSDPNEKRSIVGRMIGVASIRQGMVLPYRIAFYNIGPAEAVNVVVKDTLQISYFRNGSKSFISPYGMTNADIVEGASAPVTPGKSMGWTGAGSLGMKKMSLGGTAGSATFKNLVEESPIVSFTFTNARLRPITESVAGSNGVLQFKVPLNRNLRIGTKILNRAHIRFDTQPWISTNEAEHCVGPDFTFDSVAAGRPAQFVSLAPNGLDYLWQGPEKVVAYFWDFGDGTRGSAERNPTHTFPGPGSYNVTLRYWLSRKVQLCDTTDSVFTVVKMVRAYPVPTPTISQEGEILTSSEAAAYQWFLNGRPIVRATARSYRATQSGRYHVEVTNEGGVKGASRPIAYVAPSVRWKPSPR